jgi:hypothetical protein
MIDAKKWAISPPLPYCIGIYAQKLHRSARDIHRYEARRGDTQIHHRHVVDTMDSKPISYTLYSPLSGVFATTRQVDLLGQVRQAPLRGR